MITNLRTIKALSFLTRPSVITYLRSSEVLKRGSLEVFTTALLNFLHYLISVISLKMGRYIDITIKPMVTPRNTMRNGSIIAVRFAVVLSTSSS